MLRNVPIPQGPILDWIKRESQGEGHETKQKLIQETADLANKILASYAFYIEGPEGVSGSLRARVAELLTGLSVQSATAQAAIMTVWNRLREVETAETAALREYTRAPRGRVRVSRVDVAVGATVSDGCGGY